MNLVPEAFRAKLHAEVGMLRVKAELLLQRYLRRVVWVYSHSQTTACRAWLGLASIGFAHEIEIRTALVPAAPEYTLMLQLIPGYIWVLLYTTHGLALWFGVVTRKYNKLLLVLEGILGVALWGASAVSVALSQGSPGATVAGAGLAFWLLVRYPTHWEYSNAD